MTSILKNNNHFDKEKQTYRYRLTIEYDGTPYHGWQYQKHHSNVQGIIEESLYQFCQEEIRVFGSGRTDTGVHAIAQMAHIDISKKVKSHQLKAALNFFLRNEKISISDVQETLPNFNARLNATQRHYLYRILNRPHTSPLRKNRVYCIYNPLDIHSMRQAAHAFIGKHDFTTFRSVHCQALSPIKHMNKISILTNTKNHEVHLYFSAPSFMRHQIRSMVGSLIQVGRNKWPIEKIADILNARDRNLCGPLAPACGLYLHSICYNCHNTECVCNNL